MTALPTATRRMGAFSDPGPGQFLDLSRQYRVGLPLSLKFPPTDSKGDRRLKVEFEHLAQEWRQNTEFFSSITDIVLDAAYQQIIAKGNAVVPYILEDLQKRPDHWYWALAVITQANPAVNVPAGDIRAICDAWIDWGKRSGFLR